MSCFSPDGRSSTSFSSDHRTVLQIWFNSLTRIFYTSSLKIFVHWTLCIALHLLFYIVMPADMVQLLSVVFLLVSDDICVMSKSLNHSPYRFVSIFTYDRVTVFGSWLNKWMHESSTIRSHAFTKLIWFHFIPESFISKTSHIALY